MKVRDYIRVVLIQPTHPGNIGATARAMANMGLTRLVLVQPRSFPDSAATARAAGADHILDNAIIVSDLDQAISDCALVIGSTARPRTIKWPQLQPEEAMEKVAEIARHAPVAILFGRESRGLTNSELDRCHYLVRIPVDPEHSSLNLASAVMVLMYELRKAVASDAHSEKAVVSEGLATAEEMQHFYRHLQQVLILLEFGDGRSTKLHRKLTRLFNRAGPYAQEIRMMRGIFSAIEEKLTAMTTSE
jgi:TrmH family RNA methyltransferase